MMTPAFEDYIKTVFYIQRENGKEKRSVTTSSIAERLNIKDSSVTAMIKKLAKHKLIEYRPHRGVRLTKYGNESALKIIRKHRLIEIFLSENLSYAPDEVHIEADKLEHYISDDLMKSIENIVGDRKHGVHGESIPSLNE